MRRGIWIGLGSCVVVTALLSRGHHDVAGSAYRSMPLAAALPSAPVQLSASAATTVEKTVAPMPAMSAVVAAMPQVGDGALAGQLDLAQMQRVDDHYEIPLPNGARAKLTIEPKWQEAAEKVLREAKAPRGAVVVMAPDGRVLALAGRKTESPKGGKDGVSTPSLALDVWAPAASVFKIATATSLLRSGVSPSDKVCYHGGLRSVTSDNLVDGKNDRQCESLRYGLAHSQNAIISKFAYQHLEPKTLGRAAADLGFAGDRTSCALAGSSGTVEMPSEKNLLFAKTAAGFEGSYLSAVGGAVVANTIATRGKNVKPQIVESIISGSNTTTIHAAPSVQSIESEIAAQVGSMMETTCTAGSAAKSFRNEHHFTVAGKTGTLAQSDPYYLEYSWFVGYAPADHPQVAIAVVLGNAQNWWLKAHTAAHEVLRDVLAPEAAPSSEKSPHKAESRHHHRR